MKWLKATGCVITACRHSERHEKKAKTLESQEITGNKMLERVETSILFAFASEGPTAGAEGLHAHEGRKGEQSDTVGPDGQTMKPRTTNPKNATHNTAEKHWKRASAGVPPSSSLVRQSFHKGWERRIRTS